MLTPHKDIPTKFALYLDTPFLVEQLRTIAEEMGSSSEAYWLKEAAINLECLFDLCKSAAFYASEANTDKRKSKTAVEKSSLDLRTQNLLKHGGVSYIEDAFEMADGELLRFPNLGSKTLNAIRTLQREWRV